MSFALALAAGAFAFSAETDETLAAGVCDQISATYNSNASAALILGADGSTLNGEMLNGGRPNFYGTCTGNGEVSVNITDDPGCCTGTFDGTTIQWSNGTSWTRNPVQ
ncbi:hypothetical protein [Rhodobium gokarnense]|uniref:Uncharacterized protein n=1 Tax=Rhodobium gokarnense TaxID=364296 RepID=A0ABT3HI29_9HYPH|nr:hypothetical protein [Rhodobium gokarnense]MCW2310055.1 hypothetical protein [Rhodobium gokarnense]